MRPPGRRARRRGARARSPCRASSARSPGSWKKNAAESARGVSSKRPTPTSLPACRVVVEGRLARAGMRERELEGVALARLRVRLPAARLLAVGVPARVEVDARVVDAGRADDAPQALRTRGRRGAGSCSGRSASLEHAQADALAAGRARGTEVDGPEAPPAALEERVGLGRRDVEHHAHLEARPLGGRYAQAWGFSTTRSSSRIARSPC